MSECKYCDEGLFRLKKYYDGRLMHWDGLMAWHPCFIVEKAMNKAVSETAQESAGNPGEAVGPTLHDLELDAREWLREREKFDTRVDAFMPTLGARIYGGELMAAFAINRLAEHRRSLVSLRESAMPLIERLPHGLGPHGIGTDPARCVRCQLQTLIAERLGDK